MPKEGCLEDIEYTCSFHSTIPHLHQGNISLSQGKIHVPCTECMGTLEHHRHHVTFEVTSCERFLGDPKLGQCDLNNVLVISRIVNCIHKFNIPIQD